MLLQGSPTWTHLVRYSQHARGTRQDAGDFHVTQAPGRTLVTRVREDHHTNLPRQDHCCCGWPAVHWSHEPVTLHPSHWYISSSRQHYVWEVSVLLSHLMKHCPSQATGDWSCYAKCSVVSSRPTGWHSLPSQATNFPGVPPPLQATDCLSPSNSVHCPSVPQCHPGWSCLLAPAGSWLYLIHLTIFSSGILILTLITVKLQTSAVKKQKDKL